MSIIFFTSRLIAMMILLMLGIAFIVIVIALGPYLPNLVSPSCEKEPALQNQGVEAGEIALASMWLLALPEGKVKVGDPWTSLAPAPQPPALPEVGEFGGLIGAIFDLVVYFAAIAYAIYAIHTLIDARDTGQLVMGIIKLTAVGTVMSLLFLLAWIL